MAMMFTPLRACRVAAASTMCAAKRMSAARRVSAAALMRSPRSAPPLCASTSDALRRLLGDAQWELIPLNNLAEQLPHLPANAPVSVTASASKTLDDTLDLTAQLCALGHRPVPHIAARMVRSRGHLVELLGRVADLGLNEIFLVGGDVTSPAGPFDSAVALLENLADVDHSLTHIGVTAYPEGHALIADDVLHDALHAKQAILRSAGIEAHASTQMCVHGRSITDWLAAERQSGFVLPVHLGIPGAVEPARLLRIGTRLGIGASLRYLQKNRGAVARLMRPGGYDPSALLNKLAAQADQLNIVGLHVFTFNAIESTIAWRDTALSQLR